MYDCVTQVIFCPRNSISPLRHLNPVSLFSRKKESSELAPDPALVAEVGAYLVHRYEQRLSQKLADRQPVNLRILPFQKDQTEEGPGDYMTLKEEEVRDEIGHIFNRAYGRLLVVGLPGSGKTTLVIQLALYLLALKNKSMPVVLNLATWRAEFNSFDEWLSKILSAELGASEKLAEQIRKNTPLILLLDGLDEVPEADRASCITAIGEYGANPKHQFLISSRTAEYVATKAAPVNAQIEVAPLTIDQVEFGLTASTFLQPESKRLLNALKGDPLLRQAVESPFYLNTAQLLFASGKNWSEFGFVAVDVAGRQGELLERFVEGALVRTDEYPASKARHWLSFLASRMTSRNMVVFELRDLQYGWWRWNKGQMFFAKIIDSMVLLLWRQMIIYLCFPLPVGVIIGVRRGLVIGIFAWLVSLLFLLLVIGVISTLIILRQEGGAIHIYTKDVRKISWKDSIFFIDRNLAIAIIIATIILGLTFGLIIGSYFGVVSGVVSGGCTGLLYITLIWLNDLHNNNMDIIQISHPYQRFRASNRAWYFSILQHRHLCYLLRNQDLLPPNLLTFLNEMSHRHLLETDGATWRFRHRILQDYFAGLWMKEKEQTDNANKEI